MKCTLKETCRHIKTFPAHTNGFLVNQHRRRRRAQGEDCRVSTSLLLTSPRPVLRGNIPATPPPSPFLPSLVPRCSQQLSCLWNTVSLSFPSDKRVCLHLPRVELEALLLLRDPEASRDTCRNPPMTSVQPGRLSVLPELRLPFTNERHGHLAGNLSCSLRQHQQGPVGPQPSQGSTAKAGQDPHSAPNGGASTGPGFPHMEGGVHESHAGVPSGLKTDNQL